MAKTAQKILISVFLILFSLQTTGFSAPEAASNPPSSQIKRGIVFFPADLLGNVLGSIAKLVQWDHKIKIHSISKETEAVVQKYLADNPELSDLHVELNRWSPGEALSRLFTNKKVDARYRYTIGFLQVLISDVILINRLFGYDHYNPYTNTVYLFSDLPTAALYQLSRAKDYAAQERRGSYAFSRWLIVPDIAQHIKVNEMTFDYIHKHQSALEAEAYHVLYPHVGNYPGMYLWGIGNLVGGGIGHVWGRYDYQVLKGEDGPFETRKAI